MLTVLVVCAALIQGAGLCPAPARVVALSGRVQVVDGAGRVLLLAPERTYALPGRVYLEVGAGASAEVRWPGSGSLRLEGASACEWQPGEARLPLRVTIDRLQNAELELRATGATVELPGGWRALAAACAFGCDALSGGRLRLTQHAGAELLVDGPCTGRALWPRRALASGAELVLDLNQALPRRADASRGARPWSRVDWPWVAAPSAATGAPAASTR